MAIIKPLGASLIAVLALALIPGVATSAQKVTTGATCKVINQKITYQKKIYTCVKSGKKQVWSKGIAIAKPSASPKPSATPAPSASPTKTSAEEPTKKPEPTYLERWKTTGSQALAPFDAIYPKKLAQFKNVELIWRVSEKVPGEISGEIQARYQVTTDFWSSYTKFDFPVQVIIGDLDDIEFVCKWRGSHLQMIQPNCNTSFRTDKTRDWDAHTTQIVGKATDFYFMSDPKVLDSASFIPRVEHEFFHNVQFAQMSQYKSIMPCWAEEGGAEYFGVLLASNGNAERFLKLRALSVSAAMGRIRNTNSTPEFWKEWLYSTDMTSIVPNSSAWGCSGVSMEGIYHQGLLATEYLHLKLGTEGLLSFYRDAGIQGWDRAIENAFKKSKSDAYAEIAEYANREFLIIKSEGWAVPFCRQTCTNL
jgi:hypothetical protein